MKSPEQVAAELEEMETRKALEFNIIYISEAERIYIQKNRVTHFNFKAGEAPEPILQNVLADFDQIEAYKDNVRKSGLLNSQRATGAQQPPTPYLQFTIDGKMRTIVPGELKDPKLKKAVQDLIAGLKDISKTTKK